MNTVLVAYATKKGSTAEVAERIAATLRARGLQAEVKPAAGVRDLEAYAGVVLGGALYLGRWHRDARAFLAQHRSELARRPLAVFGIGPLTTRERDMAGARKQLDHALAKAHGIEPVAVAVFGGVVDPAKLRSPFSRMPASDARDWDAIRSWAGEVAGALDVPRAA